MWIEETEFKKIFTTLEIGNYQRGWTFSWYNKEDDEGNKAFYYFKLDRPTYLNLKLDIYSARMYA
jgi:hypothetical protein